MQKTVSFIIRTFNEEAFLGRLIETVKAQAYDQTRIEITVVDSGSTDDTVSIARDCGATLLEIPRESFNYSQALNDGIKMSSGQLLVLISAHAIPTSNDWLAILTEPFHDEKVAGVYCRQIPWPDAIWQEKIRLDAMFPEEGRRYDNPDDNTDFSNAASCIRRDLWREHPFVIMPASEDKEWSQWALSQNYSIIYESRVSAYHSHNESCRDIARRNIAICKSIDLRQSVNRTRLLTVRNALSWFCRDIRSVITSSYCQGQRCKAMLDCAKQSFWFYTDMR